jgi:hypothetical protein
MNDAVNLSDVRKSFGDVPAVDGLSLTIRPGETVALLGPNGAGKSTTIGMLLGLSTPDSGTVELFGASPVRAVRAGKVGAMLQDAGFVPNATVRELVELARALYPMPLPTGQILHTSGLQTWRTAGWTSCPAARRSGRGSRSRWPAIHGCCCWTSRPRRWTFVPGRHSGPRCAGTRRPGTRCCSRRTTWRRRTTTPSAWWSSRRGG